MSDLLSYLLERFRTDAEVLRRRAVALRTGPKQPGPDAATSQRMAEACADVVAMLEAIPADDGRAQAIDTLTALVPLLERRADGAQALPPVRAVYAGAAVRVREVVDVERRHAERSADASSFDDPSIAHAGAAVRDDDDDGDFDDDELDDDELHDDALDDDAPVDDGPGRP